MLRHLTDAEKKVLRELAADSDRPQKLMSRLCGMSQSEFTRTKQSLIQKGVLKKYTIDVDYRNIGFPDGGIFLFSIKDKKSIMDTVNFLAEIPEIVEIIEVFGHGFDIIVRIMCEDNEKFRHICRKITQYDNVVGDINTFSFIYSTIYKIERGVPI